MIAHYGEDVPADGSYAPLRYGRLAEALTERGHHVTRISPSFSHARRVQRSTDASSSSEGHHHIVLTTDYVRNAGWNRAVFLLQLLIGVYRYLRAERQAIDVVLVGVPPPGLTTIARLGLGRGRPVISDVRDLWPDAFANGDRERWAPIAKLGGKLISQELRVATTSTAITESMLAWTPKSNRGEVIPIGMSDRELHTELFPETDSALQVCFLSATSHRFYFRPVLEGWARYVEEVKSGGSTEAGGPQLSFIGTTPSDDRALGLAESDPTVKLVGRVPADTVGTVLNAIDIGLYTCTESWAYSLGNKIFDYLSSGLYILHSLAPDASAEIAEAGLGQHVHADAESWYQAFCDLHRGRAELRAGRLDRLEVATHRYGGPATSGHMCSLIEGLAESMLPRA